jgi:predicted CoA-binding protein
MYERERIDRFLSAGPWAVAGASTDRAKYGNKVLRCYLQAGKTPVYPLNPIARAVEGLPAFPDLAAVPEPVRALSIITPPPITERVVAQALELGVAGIWMQPGAESAAAVRACEQAGVDVIHGGTCILVVLGYRE